MAFLTRASHQAQQVHVMHQHTRLWTILPIQLAQALGALVAHPHVHPLPCPTSCTPVACTPRHSITAPRGLYQPTSQHS
eukprot:3064550-Prymnesium_polylepis.1